MSLNTVYSLLSGVKQVKDLLNPMVRSKGISYYLLCNKTLRQPPFDPFESPYLKPSPVVKLVLKK